MRPQRAVSIKFTCVFHSIVTHSFSQSLPLSLQLTKIEFPFRIQFAQSAFPELKFEAGGEWVSEKFFCEISSALEQFVADYNLYSID